ncbi:MAG: NUDIX hydrolase [Peptococcaceae bacterium]|nr:NUDIX hydrolase [Peptococcaceae bacterium]
MSKFEEKCIKKETIFEGKIIKVERDTVILPDGKKAIREVVRHPGAVGIVALIDNMILMVRQYRYALAKETIEIPAGKIDQNEKPISCAIRELREETGYQGKMTFLGLFNTSPGFADEVIYLYLAHDLIWSPLATDEDEFLGVVKLPWNDAVEMAITGQIQDAKSSLGILLANRFLNSSQIFAK